MKRGKALDGFRVVEVASLVAGPFATRLLADLGAEVIKVEPPEGDPARRRGPFPGDVPDPERSLLFFYLNLNKRGVTLDPSTATGRDLLLRLVAVSDALVEDLPPGTLERWGIGGEDLRRANPTLVHLALTPFGSSGPYRDYKATDLIVSQMGGEGWLTPSGLSAHLFPDREPLKLGGHLGDYYCGTTAAVGLLGALLTRRWSGVGQFVDVSRQECHLALSRRPVVTYATLGILETRFLRERAFGGTIRCTDGFLEMLVLEEHQWQGLVRMMGEPEWARDPALQDLEGRRQRGAEIQARIQEWAQGRTREEVYRLALENGVPVGPIYSPGEVLQSPHLRERGYFQPVSHPLLGEVQVPQPGFYLSLSPWAVERPAPRLGEHNEEVYCGLLGLPHPDLSLLRRAGVI